ncbi:MAG: NUDIX hydrolase [Pseudomonadota bacterium]|nr:NUDIX hydrolase [Pseudomonadota bacterium]
MTLSSSFSPLSHNEGPRVGLGVVIINPDGYVLLGQRTSPHGFGAWGIPGGHLEYGESFEDCAIRETLEETGLVIAGPTFLSLTNVVFPDTGKHYVTVYMKALLPPGQKATNPEPEKISEWRWFSPDSLPSPLFLPFARLVEENHDLVLSGCRGEYHAQNPHIPDPGHPDTGSRSCG